MQYQFTGTYRTPTIAADASFVVSGVTGDVTNAVFWGEPLVGQLDGDVEAALAQRQFSPTMDTIGATALFAVGAAGCRFRLRRL